MLKPTTKDLASHLGMSRSTVDRVLNGRPGVKEATVKAVRMAIAELGFERNISAANLAKKRVYRFVFILPRAKGDFLTELETQLEELAKALKTDNTLIAIKRTVDADQNKLVEQLSRLTMQDADGVAILAPESPQLRDALARLATRGVHVVRLISGQANGKSEDFVGVDNKAAGRTAARLLGSFAKSKTGNMLLVTDTMTSPDSTARRAGFDEILQTRFPYLNALPTLETYGSVARARKILSSATGNFPDLQGVYIMGSEARTALKTLNELGHIQDVSIVAHEKTKVTLEFLRSGLVDALIVQDPGHVVRSAARKLRAKCDQRAPVATQDNVRLEILLKENLLAYDT